MDGDKYQELYLRLRQTAPGEEARNQLMAEVDALADSADPGEQVTGLLLRGHERRFANDYDTARELHEESLKIASEIGDRLSEAYALRGLGEVARLGGEYDTARERYEASLTIAREIDDRLGEANALRGLGDVAGLGGEYDTARERYEASLTIAREIGTRLGEMNALLGLAEVARMGGEYDTARERYEASLTIAREIGARLGEMNALRGLGDVALPGGEYDTARERYEASLTIAREIGDRLGEMNALWSLGEVSDSSKEASSRFAEAAKLAHELDLTGIEEYLEARAAHDGGSDYPASDEDGEDDEDGENKFVRGLWETFGSNPREVIKASEDDLAKRLQQQARVHDIPPAFISLKGCGSYIPLIESDHKGGGFLLVWKGQGICIDPGLGFIRNLLDAELNVTDLCAIVLTHNHTDHVGDVLGLATLLVEYNEWKEESGVKDNDSHGVQLVLSPMTAQMFGPLAIADRREFHSVHLLQPCMGDEDAAQELDLKDELGIKLRAFRTIHREIGGAMSGLALRMELWHSNIDKPKRTIGITGDSRYFDELADFLKNVDLLVLHVGSFYGVEWPTDGTDKLPKGHLGLRGSYKMLKRLQDTDALPEAVFIVEIGAEIRGQVDEFAKQLKKEFGCPVHVGRLGAAIELKNGLPATTLKDLLSELPR